MSVSPLDSNVLTSPTVEFTLQNGQKVEMTVDIDLEGNTGEPKFEMQVPDVWADISQTNAGFLPSPGSINFNTNAVQNTKSGPVTKEVMEIIKNDNNGIVKSNYDYVINNIKEQIESEGGNLQLFNERLSENGNADSDTVIAEASTENGNSENVKVDDEGISTPESVEAPQVKKENLVYPIDMFTGRDGSITGGKSQDYIFLEQFQYEPPNPVKGKKLFAGGEVVSDKKETPMNMPPDVLKYGVRRSNNISEDFGTCALPIPNQLDVSNGVSWGQARANSVELAGFSAANSNIREVLSGNKDIIQTLRSGVKGAGETFETLKKAIQNPDPNNPDVGNILSAGLAKAVLAQLNINVDIDQFITRQTGAAINPNLELLFGGPQLRTFSFVFDFAPNSSKEAVMVRKIQRWFRQGMLPARSGASGARPSSLFLGSPNVFRISYRNHGQRIKGLNIIKICALTSCQVNFTPDGTYQSYEDAAAISQPVRSSMKVTFNELTPIFRDDYREEISGSNFVRDPSLEDLGANLQGSNAISDQDIGF
tara:strand:- start:873 stop:2486 length:1614 start_codon:yes stop_codon:yes gene_type:complete